MIRDWTASEAIDGLSTHAEVFFTRLIMKADDYGNYTANIKLIKSALFPLKEYTSEEVQGWLNECVEAGLIQPYHVDGKSLIHIRNFDQKLRRMHSVYPPPPVGQVTDNERTSDGQVTDKRPLEEKKKRREEEVEERREKTREWFDGCIDEMYRETLEMTHKGKNLAQAMAEAWAFLAADANRLRAADSSDVKKLVNTWLGNMKAGRAAKQKPDIKKFLADA